MPASDNRREHEPTLKLKVRGAFESLAVDEIKDEQSYTIYAHHLARACWHGSRIMLRQTSPEAEGIFDFILELHRACSGRWYSLGDLGIKQEDIDKWLDFAGMFLSSLGNYFVSSHRSLRASMLYSLAC